MSKKSNVKYLGMDGVSLKCIYILIIGISKHRATLYILQGGGAQNLKYGPDYL
jgi:hypothetical protein